MARSHMRPDPPLTAAGMSGRTMAALAVGVAITLLAPTGVRAQVPAGQPSAAPAAEPAPRKAPRAKSQSAKQPGKGQSAGGEQQTGAAAASPPRLGAADAQRLIDGAQKSLQAGKADAAISQLTRVVSLGGLPTPIMAQALYQRGMAYRRQSRPAQAISDLTSAIWLKGGLNETDRAEALKHRAAAFRDAGLPDQAGGDTPNAAQPRAAAIGGASGPAVAPPVLSAAPDAVAAPPPDAGSGVGGFLANIFGGAKQEPPAQAAPPKATASIQPQIGAWSSDTSAPAGAAKGARKVVPQAAPAPGPVAQPQPLPRQAQQPLPRQAQPQPAPQKLAAVPQAAAVPTPVAKSGRIRIQVASLKSREEAQALITRLQREHGAAMSGYQASIDSAEIGAFGIQHRVRIGPFARAEESQALCARLKAQRLDCMIVAQ